MAIARAGIAACDAARLTRDALEGARRRTDDRQSPRSERAVCIAAGKAAVAMAQAAVTVLDNRLQGGLIVAPAAHPFDRFEVIVGGHPLPDAGSERGGRRALELAASLGTGDTLLVLLSGGASALMAVPADGVSLDDKRRTTLQLLQAGADIHALNTVRKHLSAIKGGWLAVGTAAAVVTYAISDVVGDDVSVIASGPTVADDSTFEDARRLVNRYGGAAAFPDAVVARLDRGVRGDVPETPKRVDPRLARSTVQVIGSRRDAMRGAVASAAARGYSVVCLDDPVVGESRVAAVSHVRAALARASTESRPLCVISSGETTVHVTGQGTGGRNQEFALAAAAAVPIASPFILASVGTDGVDGPTDAAGAMVDSTTLDRARTAGLEPQRFLRDNDAHRFFEALGDLIRTGPTGTNVGDLQLVLLA